MKHKQNGFAHIGLLLVLVLIVVGAAGWLVYKRSQDKTTENSAQTQQSTIAQTQQKVEEKPKEPDSADTLATPEKVTSADGKAGFVYGAPAGQNNKETKRIIVSLPGHSTTAADGYEAWKLHLASLNGGSYALAEFDWWDGTGNETANYYDPVDATEQMRSFLKEQGYTSKDIVVLHGFSRGSANTYAVIANDQKSGSPMIDAAISNAGKYQKGFPFFKDGTQPTIAEFDKYYKNFPWVLVCGGKDPEPELNGCEGMTETKTFLEAHKVNLLALLTDADQGHGVFHLSDKQLPKQAIDLIEAAL